MTATILMAKNADTVEQTSDAQMAATSLLRVENLTRHFGGLAAVNDVSFTADAGLIVGLVGPNGAGKTTVFNLISGILRPDAGAIYFAGTRIDRLRPYEIARAGLGRTFQDPRLFYEMTVLDHVLSGFRLRAENPLLALLRDRRTREEWDGAVARARSLLDRIGLSHRVSDLSQDLSFGEQRFLSIARSLAADPRLLLLDEPTVGLDAESIAKLVDLIRAISAEGRSVLLVEHNMDVVLEVCDRICLLVEGRICATGTSQEIERHPKMIESYLGASHVARR